MKYFLGEWCIEPEQDCVDMSHIWSPDHVIVCENHAAMQ